jgi:hypothetical protein
LHLQPSAALDSKPFLKPKFLQNQLNFALHAFASAGSVVTEKSIPIRSCFPDRSFGRTFVPRRFQISGGTCPIRRRVHGSLQFVDRFPSLGVSKDNSETGLPLPLRIIFRRAPGKRHVVQSWGRRSSARPLTITARPVQATEAAGRWHTCCPSGRSLLSITAILGGKTVGAGASGRSGGSDSLVSKRSNLPRTEGLLAYVKYRERTCRHSVSRGAQSTSRPRQRHSG